MVDRGRTRHSIARSVTGSTMLTTGVALVLACAVFVAWDTRVGRRDLVEKGELLGQVVGSHSAVALQFHDRTAAAETLAGLADAKQVRAAVIYDAEGVPFARFAADEETFEVPAVEAPGHRFAGARVDVFRAIAFRGKAVGTIYLSLDTSALAARVRWYAAITAALLAGALLCCLMMATWLRRRLTRPLEALVEGSEAISGGDLSRRVSVDADDELGVLARTFNAMTTGLGGLVVQVRHSTTDVAEVSRLLERHAAQLFLGVERQAAAIDDSGASVAQVTESIHEVNSSVERLSEASHETSSSILEMDASIGEIASHMDHLTGAIDTTSGAVSELGTNIDQVVSGVDTLQTATEGTVERLQELSRSVRQVRDHAAESHELSEDSSQSATEGMDAVRETIGAMGEIQLGFGQLSEQVNRLAQKSRSIDEIVQVIGDVAEQTGLLSVNAAIIAAQAGEHGKAFSVVAEQVSSLADRTRRSTREIADLLRAVQDDTTAAVGAVKEGSERVDRGVQRSNLAGEVLNRILDKTHLSTDRAREIAEATARQSEDLERVERAVRDVQEIVERINRSSYDQHTATREIRVAVDNIRDLCAAVRRSTEEQRRGSHLIANASSNVTSMISQIAESTHAQTKSSATIQEALEVFSAVTDETRGGAESMNTSVATLSERARRLEQEIGRFKVD